MNKIIEKFLFTEDKFMLELHLKQPEFNYSACAPFTNHSERIRNFRETGNLKHLYRSKLDKVCFAHDAAYSESSRILLEIVPMRDIKEQYQVWSMNFLIKRKQDRELERPAKRMIKCK